MPKGKVATSKKPRKRRGLIGLKPTSRHAHLDLPWTGRGAEMLLHDELEDQIITLLSYGFRELSVLAKMRCFITLRWPEFVDRVNPITFKIDLGRAIKQHYDKQQSLKLASTPAEAKELCVRSLQATILDPSIGPRNRAYAVEIMTKLFGLADANTGGDAADAKAASMREAMRNEQALYKEGAKK